MNLFLSKRTVVLSFPFIILVRGSTRDGLFSTTLDTEHQATIIRKTFLRRETLRFVVYLCYRCDFIAMPSPQNTCQSFLYFLLQFFRDAHI